MGIAIIFANRMISDHVQITGITEKGRYGWSGSGFGSFRSIAQGISKKLGAFDPENL
jgi:hypothetical protein